MRKIEFKNKAQYLRYFILLLAFSLFACEDVIQVDLENGDSKIVIDAEILWQKGTDGSVQTIKISRMADYYNLDPPRVSGAQVYIENSEGTVFTFFESEGPGTYICNNFVPQLNGTYTLYVSVEGQVYTASETMIPVTEIDRVEQKLVDDFGTDAIELSFYFNDPVNEANYYLSSFVTDLLLYPEYELTDDEFNNGNEMKSDFSEEDLKPGKMIDVTLRGISLQFYNYMDLILDATDAGPFGTPPANIRGNIVNQNNPGDYALGYFRLCESDHFSYTIQ